MDVSTHLLRLFLAVARHGSFTRAAEEFYVSQPAASAGIARLERLVGVRLFDRRPRRLELTPMGQVFHDQVRAAVTALDLGVDEARRRGRTRPVTVVYQSPTIGSAWVPALLDAWTEVIVEEREVELGAWRDAVEDGSADLAVVHCAGVEDGHASVEIGRDELVVVMSETVAERFPGGPVDLRDLTGPRLLIWRREQAPAYYDLVLDAFRRAGADPVVDERLQRVTTRAGEIADGSAVAVLPAQASTAGLAGLTSRPVAGGLTVPVDLVWRADEKRREVLAAVDAAQTLTAR